LTWVLSSPVAFGYGALVADVRVSSSGGETRDILQKFHPVGRMPPPDLHEPFSAAFHVSSRPNAPTSETTPLRYGFIARTVIAIGPNPTGLHACRRRPTATVSASNDDLAWFFRTGDAVDRGDLTGVSVAAIDRLRTLREAFRRPILDELYLEWQRHGEAPLASSVTFTPQHGMRSVGTHHRTLAVRLQPVRIAAEGRMTGPAPDSTPASSSAPATARIAARH